MKDVKEQKEEPYFCMCEVVSIVSPVDLLGKDGEGIKVKMKSASRESGDCLFKVGDSITYDKFTGKVFHIVGVNEDVFTLELNTNGHEEFIDFKYLSPKTFFFKV